MMRELFLHSAPNGNSRSIRGGNFTMCGGILSLPPQSGKHVISRYVTQILQVCLHRTYAENSTTKNGAVTDLRMQSHV